MSLLVEVRNQPRVVNGELVEPGKNCRLPNSLAVHLERIGRVAWPTERSAMAAGKEQSEKRKASKARLDERKAEGKRKENKR